MVHYKPVVVKNKNKKKNTIFAIQEKHDKIHNTCFASAIGTVFPSSLRQRLIRSRLRFSMTLCEMGVLCGKKQGRKSKNK